MVEPTSSHRSMADRSQTHFYEVFVTLQDAVALDDRMTLMMAHRHGHPAEGVRAGAVFRRDPLTLRMFVGVDARPNVDQYGGPQRAALGSAARAVEYALQTLENLGLVPKTWEPIRWTGDEAPWYYHPVTMSDIAEEATANKVTDRITDRQPRG